MIRQVVALSNGFEFNSSSSSGGCINGENNIFSYWKSKESSSSAAYITEKIVNKDGNGFVMYCPDCSEIVALENYILYNEKIYTEKDFKELFPEHSYDGSHYALIFRCPSCNKIFDMNWKYQENLSFEAKGTIKWLLYSYYNGYNSDVNYLNDTAMSK
jgi:uncharacterized C2H2 Zn-finger protein